MTTTPAAHPLPEGFVLTGVNHPDCDLCLGQAIRQAEEIATQEFALGSSTLSPRGYVEPRVHGASVTHVERTRAAEADERARVLDVATSMAPTGRVDMADRVWQVMATAFTPDDRGLLPGHHAVLAAVNDDVWAEADTDTAPALDEPRFAVSTLVHDDDDQESYWHQGDYDLTYAEALAEFGRRVAKDAR